MNICLRTGTRLILAATLVAGSMVGVSWCNRTLAVSSNLQVAVTSLMVPPFLVLILTLVREVQRLNGRRAS
jgi:hypothetical protein